MLAVLVPETVLNAVLPPELFFIGLVVGAVCAAVAIMLTCGVDAKRTSIAAGIYLFAQVGLSLGLGAMFRS